MSMICLVSLVAWAEPTPEVLAPQGRPEALADAPAPPKVRRKRALRRARRARNEEVVAREVAEVPSRLQRGPLCEDLVRQATALTPDTLADLRAACPSFFPVPAPPTFCRVDPCVTDVRWTDGTEQTASATRVER